MATIALLRLIGQLSGYPPGPVLAAFGREHKNATDRSVAAILEAKIEAAGLRPLFEFRREWIRYRPNGSEVLFVGLNRDTVESLRSVEGLALVWVEEAHRLSEEVADALIPTVRAAGSELWFSWNPILTTDWTWQRFVEHPRPGDVSLEATWRMNPWFPSELDAERRALETEDPARAAHVYGGLPKTDAAELVLPPARLRACIGERLTPDHRYVEAGFDLAHGGANKCALVVRQGADVLRVEQWPGGDFEATCRRVHRRIGEHLEGRPGRLWFDASGGHPVAQALRRAAAAGGPRLAGRRIGAGEYAVRPVMFGEAPSGGDRPYERGVLNRAMFARRNAQLAWAVRLRVPAPGVRAAGVAAAVAGGLAAAGRPASPVRAADLERAPAERQGRDRQGRAVAGPVRRPVSGVRGGQRRRSVCRPSEVRGTSPDVGPVVRVQTPTKGP